MKEEKFSPLEPKASALPMSYADPALLGLKLQDNIENEMLTCLLTAAAYNKTV